MNPQTLPINMISPSHSARLIDDRTVAALEASMADVGLLQAIIVRKTMVMQSGLPTPGYRIMAGHHRVEAARGLGWTTIEANVLDDSTSDLAAELIEIDENLCRAELTPAQRAMAIKRRKQIWEALHPESGTNCSTLTGRGNVQFAAETAAVSGQSKQDINRHLSRAEVLGDDLAEVTGTSLDKGVELDALKTLQEPERKDLIARAKAGEPVSARKPAARISLTIEYFDVHDGASSIAYSIIRRDPALARALLAELQTQLKEAA